MEASQAAQEGAGLCRLELMQAGCSVRGSGIGMACEAGVGVTCACNLQPASAPDRLDRDLDWC